MGEPARMRERIQAELARIEAEYRVRVLLAVESGSRAWGFASPDSDYDVRFIYAHDRDWYISVFESRDVIEEMLPGDLDISGWDLRKTLRLFAKCNLALNEWVDSPETYLDVPSFRGQLAALIPTYFNEIAAIHHYQSMAHSAFVASYSDDSIGVKKLFYVLRPLLACRWIEHARSQPPTEFAKLVDQAWISIEEKEWIAGLLDTKARVAEAQRIPLSMGRVDAIQRELERYKSAATIGKAPEKRGIEALDEVLRAWVGALQ